jgi:FkbM family methyltransferase
MKPFKYIGYFMRLRVLIGLKAAIAFVLAHMRNKINPPHVGSLARVPVGPYVFYFPSLTYFEGLFTEIFFKKTYHLEQTNKPIKAIDCGANIGMSLLYIKLRAPNANVICFEPNPSARAVLEKNIEANNWREDVRVLPYALGKKKDVTEFFVDDKEATSSGGSIVKHHKNKNQTLNSYTVEVDTLSQYINESIDFLKIDIEGAEFDVLEEVSAEKKLHFVATIQLEYHYIPGFFTRPLSEMLALLESEGFRTSVQYDTPAHKVLNNDAWHTCMIFAWRK